MRLIPSLDGALYQFDGEKVEAIPVSAESLLSSTYKLGDDSMIVGSKDLRNFGVNLLTGKVTIIRTFSLTLSVNLSVFLSFCLFIHLSFHPFIHPSIPFIHPIYPSILLFSVTCLSAFLPAFSVLPPLYSPFPSLPFSLSALHLHSMLICPFLPCAVWG